MNSIKVLAASLLVLGVSQTTFAQISTNPTVAAANALQQQVQNQLESFAQQRNLTIQGSRIEFSNTPEGFSAIAPFPESLGNVDLTIGQDVAAFFISPSKTSSVALKGGFYILRLQEDNKGLPQFEMVNAQGSVVDIVPAKIEVKPGLDQVGSDTEASMRINSTSSTVFESSSSVIGFDIHSIPGGCWITGVGGSIHGTCWISVE